MSIGYSNKRLGCGEIKARVTIDIKTLLLEVIKLGDDDLFVCSFLFALSTLFCLKFDHLKVC